MDRDGVLNALRPDPLTGKPESPLKPEDVALLPGVATALRSLTDGGWLLVGVSNQPSAAKGKASLETLQAVHSRVLHMLAAEGALFDEFRLCLHHPDGLIPGLAKECECRKPAPGMLLAAAADLEIDLAGSWMVGDTDTDVEAGTRAGCRTILVAHGPSTHKRRGAGRADSEASDFPAAVRIILSEQGVHLTR